MSDKLTEVEELRVKVAEYERVLSDVYSLLAPSGRQGRTYVSDVRKARVLLCDVPSVAVSRAEPTVPVDRSSER